MLKLLILLFAYATLTLALIEPPNNFGFLRPLQFGFGHLPQFGTGRLPQFELGPGSGNGQPGNGGNLGGSQNDCPGGCPPMYDPVCGFNGTCYKNFGNLCELKAAACSGQGSGNLIEVPLSECNRPGVQTCLG